eukprot:COSAG06_NODE_971_length_11273_cov_54.583497_4_plen_102_part_00
MHAGRLRAAAAAVAAPQNGDAEADTDAALDTACEELKTACALAKQRKEGSGGCPPHTEETEMCARFYLGARQRPPAFRQIVFVGFVLRCVLILSVTFDPFL